MGIREWANKNQKQAAGVSGVFIALAIGLVVYEILASRQKYPSDVPDAFYTVDDGQTYFVAKGSNVAPFDYDGKPAVRAYVFAGASGKKFVGFLERYSAESKKLIAGGQAITPYMARYGREVKKPGDTQWVKTGDLKVEGPIEDVKPPDGGDPSALVSIDP